MTDANATVSDRVVVALRRAKVRIAELEAKLREPIAILGAACRFPGGPTPEAFWASLLARADMVREIPDDRLIGPWPEGVPRWAGLLDDIAGFDPAFFGISPFEAMSVDPQQRMLLEVAWESLERAMIVPSSLRGSKTGVFVGLTSSEYHRRTQLRSPDERSAYDVTGIMLSAGSGRISYVLGFQGPALTVDTACSSSLVAIHLACQSLRAGDSNLALAGGAKLIASEHYLDELSHTQGLSPDGRCRAFDAGANGFVLGEGCGMLVLKRLSDAQRDGDPILGIIPASGVNQDGRSTGLTAPNVLSQTALLREVLRRADLKAEDIDYIECHGTGTPLGDPIEIEAIKTVYGGPRPPTRPLWLGAVKTNIGHLEAASGVAGVVKILLALEHGAIPPNIHLRHVNPRIKLAGTGLEIPTRVVPWATPSMCAAVSSFGMSGTNAHVLIQRAPQPEPPTRAASLPGSPPLVLSGTSHDSLMTQAGRLRAHLVAHPDISTIDLAYSLATTRTHFEHRACIVAPDVLAALEELARTGRQSSAITGASKLAPKLAMLFTGQGAQRPGMTKSLYDALPVFRAKIDEIAAACDASLEFPLLAVLLADPDEPAAARIDQTQYTQPGLFAYEVALAAQWRAWGVVPQVLVGHSIGELAAAHVAGVLSLPDACKLVCARGRLMQALPAGGVMISIQASEHEVVERLADHPGVDVAGYNGPLSTVISGDEDASVELARHFEGLGRKTTRLVVSHAFHSHHMDAMLAEFRRIANSVEYHLAQIPVIANRTGALAREGEISSPEYWVRHVREPVRFLDGVRALETFGASILLEVGPHGVLSSMASACLSEAAQRSVVSVVAQRRDKPTIDTLSVALGTLHCHGVEIDWASYLVGGRRVPLPTYGFQRERFWYRPTRRATSRTEQAGILGERLSSPLVCAQFRTQLHAEGLPLHVGQAIQCLHPGLLLSMLAVAKHETLGTGDGVAIVTELEPAIELGPDDALGLQITIDTPGERESGFAIDVENPRVPARWRSVAKGRLTVRLRPTVRSPAVAPLQVGPLGPLPPASSPTAPCRFLARPTSDDHCRFELRLQPAPVDLDHLALHPAVLDAALQVALAQAGESPLSTFEVLGWDTVEIHGQVPAVFELVLSRLADDGDPTWDFDLVDPAGAVLIRIERLALRRLGLFTFDPNTSSIDHDLESRILEITKHTLGFTPSLDDDFASMHGVDSLSLMGFMSAIQKEYGVSLQRLYGARASFSVRALLGILGGQVAGSQHTGVSFLRPDAPVELSEANTEVLPRNYGVDHQPRTWLCKVGDLFELEVVDFAGDEAHEPVVFLPPFNTEWPVWLPIIRTLVPARRVLAINYPGLGRSRGAEGFQDARRLAAWICWALDALGVTRLALVGWSLGGFLTQQIAAARPDLVARLVLVNTTTKLEGADTAAGTEYLIRTLEADLEAHLLTITDLEQRGVLRDLVYHGYDKRDIELSYYSIIATWDFREEVKTIIRPTLIVVGGNDELTLPRYGEYMHQSIQGSRLEILPTAHYLPLFATEAFCKLLREFLDQP